MKIFIPFLLLFSAFTLQANTALDPFVHDPNHLLSPHTVTKLHKILNEGTKQGIQIRYFISNNPNAELMSDENINQQIQHWEAKHPLIADQKNITFVFLNTHLKKGWIFTHQHSTGSYYNGLMSINNKIISPALKNNDLDTAVWESSIALTTMFEKWSVVTSEDFILPAWFPIFITIIFIGAAYLLYRKYYFKAGKPLQLIDGTTS